jgi:hypothetical protein
VTSSAAALRPGRAARPASSAVRAQRSVRRRVTLAWALLILNVLTFYPRTWSGLPLLIPVPATIGKMITQGALPAALLVALTVNRRLVIRPNVFLCLLTLLVVEAVLTLIRGEYLSETLTGTLFRTTRLGGFAATLWLLSPWWGRRDLLLIRCYLTSVWVVLGSVLVGLAVAPGDALDQGRLSGTLWPIPPTQVAHYAAVTTGLLAVLWLGGMIRGRPTLLGVCVSITMLLLTHTRTALVAMLAGLLVAGLSMFAGTARVRRLFAAASAAAAAGAITVSGVVTTWLARGESSRELGNLTGRTSVWDAIVNLPRDRFQVIFGFGLSNKSFQGLPIDSNWLACYFDQGLAGVIICAGALLFLFAAAYFQPRGPHRALALFLVTYCLLASLTETGLSDASTYLLELTMAASLLVPPLANRSPA